MRGRPEAGSAAGPHGGEPVGTLAEEAARLVAALAGATREHHPDGDSAASDSGDRAASGASDASTAAGLGDLAAAALHDVQEHLATGGAECRFCPVCRAVDLLRQTSPEVREHLSEAARSLSRAVAALLAPAEEVRRTPRSGAGVERIDLSGDEFPDADDADDADETGATGEEPAVRRTRQAGQTRQAGRPSRAEEDR